MLAPSDRLSSFEDPVAFQSDILKRRLWARQKEIVQAIRNHRDVAIKGCHASGKTYVVSGVPLYWLLQARDAKVFTTSPTLRQVKLFWSEVSLAHKESRIRFPECSSTGLKISDERYAIGASATHGVNIQGLHGRFVLIVADEAMGISSEVWDAIEGIRAGGQVHLVKLGNPTVPSGQFFDSFKDPNVYKITISAFDTPNFAKYRTRVDPSGALRPDELHLAVIDELRRVRARNAAELDNVAISFLVSPRWVLDRFESWGPDHPKYQGRVLAIFPTQAANACFTMLMIEQSKRDPTPAEAKRWEFGGIIQVGIDVAGEGDDETTLCARVNGHILGLWGWSDADSRGKVMAKLSELRRMNGFTVGPVVVDTVGIGYNFALHLADHNYDVRSFVAGAKPRDREQFRDMKSEEYWRLRTFMQNKLVSGLDDEMAEAQLASILFSELPTGQTYIESKADARKRGVKYSPDRAEAVVMAFANIQPREAIVEDDGEPDETLIGVV